MDTRRTTATNEPAPAPDRGFDTAPFDLVELVELRPVIVVRGTSGLGALIPAVILTAAVMTIAFLAIVTRAGWSWLAS